MKLTHREPATPYEVSCHAFAYLINLARLQTYGGQTHAGQKHLTRKGAIHPGRLGSPGGLNAARLMEWLKELFTGVSVAHSLLILALVAASGVLLGSFKIKGVGLGIAGVLFTGLLFGHFGFHIEKEVMEFVREFGLILFVYTIGMQVGPGFVASLRKQGLPLNLMAATVVILGALITVGIVLIAGIDMSVAVGLFSGGTTNTPALGAAQQALKNLPSFTEEMAKNPGLGYAVAYPFGIMGIILTMGLIRGFFRVQPTQEAAEFTKQMQSSTPKLNNLNLVVTNPNLDGLPIEKIPGLTRSGVVLSRVLKGNEMDVATPDTVLHLGDIVHAVGAPDKLKEIQIIIGKVSDVDLKSMPSHVTTRRVVVTKKSVLGKSIEELDLDAYGVAVTRVSRAEIEFTPTPNIRLQFADTLLLVGEEEAIVKAAKELGNSPKQLNHPQIVPIFVGIALGVIVGSIPFHFPNMPAAVKLGLAGGPLLVAIILSRIGRVGPLIYYMPLSANFMLRELGITLFLACVGLKAGDQFVKTLTQGDGFMWMGMAALITLIPILLVGLFARAIYKLNYTSICGVLAGSMTDPPALAFANAMTGSDAPSISYATVYPLTMLLRVLAAQLLVLLFMS
jgi:putative transport protein